jgi:micrococcal nuclease
LVLLLSAIGIEAAVTGCALVRTSHGHDRAAGAAMVVRVVDGDTVVLRFGGRDESVRLLGVDTPETKDPRRPIQCFGKEASPHTTHLLPPGTRVEVARDVEPRDRYGRLLLSVWRARDHLFVNLELAADGYADTLTYPPNLAHTAELTEAVARARQTGRGLWGACDGPDQPVDPAPGGS